MRTLAGSHPETRPWARRGRATSEIARDVPRPTAHPARATRASCAPYRNTSGRYTRYPTGGAAGTPQNPAMIPKSAPVADPAAGWPAVASSSNPAPVACSPPAPTTACSNVKSASGTCRRRPEPGPRASRGQRPGRGAPARSASAVSFRADMASSSPSGRPPGPRSAPCRRAAARGRRR